MVDGPLEDRYQGSFDLLNAHAGLTASDHAQPLICAVLQGTGTVEEIRPRTHRQGDFRRFPERHATKSGGSYSDDCGDLGVDSYGLSDDSRIAAKPALPICMAEDCNRRSRGGIIGGIEQS